MRTLQCFYFLYFFLPMKTWKNWPKKLPIIGQNLYFSVMPSGPNLNSCSIKISHHGTSLKWLWLAPPRNINNFCERLLRNNKQTQKKIGNEDVELLPINLPKSQTSADVVWSFVYVAFRWINSRVVWSHQLELIL